MTNLKQIHAELEEDMGHSVHYNCPDCGGDFDVSSPVYKAAQTLLKLIEKEMEGEVKLVCLGPKLSNKELRVLHEVGLTQDSYNAALYLSPNLIAEMWEDG